MRILLIALGTLTLLTGPVALFAPRVFYESVPGLSMMGPFNLHFISDVGLAFIASGTCIVYGAYRNSRHVAIAGALWPLLHGLFHLQLWLQRGSPFDAIAAFDFSAVITPPLVIMALACRLEHS